MKLGVYIRTYGCQMNQYDSDLIFDLLSRRGYTHATDPDQCQVLIVNTCSVRDHAERRALGYLASLRSWRRTAGRVLAVVGCMARRLGPELIARYPHVDLILGPDDYRRIADDIDEIIQRQNRIIRIDRQDELYEGLERRPQSSVCDFVAITRGCSNYCAYCIVPAVRGPVRSRRPEAVWKEIKCLAASGVKDITLLGQNVNEYRCGPTGFVDLLLQTRDIPGNFRLRFLTSHPKDFDYRLIAAVREYDRLCEWFHLPLQSGSDRILKMMNRRYTRDDYRRIAAAIRDALPAAVLTTDLIVGFPTETDAEFQATLACVDELDFTYAYTYRYSPRAGTAASRLPSLPEPVILNRLAELIKHQHAVTRRCLQRMIGQEYELLIERENAGGVLGRTRGGVPVAVKEKRTPGEFCRVRIVKISGRTPIGELAGEKSSKAP